MLNFRNTNILFAVSLICMALVNSYSPFSALFYIIPLLLYSLALFYGSYSIRSGFYIPVLCAARTQDKIVAISFDDGPDRESTPEILEILENNGIKAAFFCIGKRIE